MTTPSLEPIGNLEDVYECLAVAIDRAGPDKAAVFLAKVVLLLAARLDDPRAAQRAIDEALADL